MTDQAPGKKRALIAESGKTMFIWVAAMSAVVGMCVVLAYFLWLQLSFRTKVVNAKNDTVQILKDNNAAVDELKNNVRVLETNSALASAKADPDEKSLQVILDALPADNNASALGASLQQKLFADINKLTVESMNVGGEVTDGTTSESGNTISFTATVSSSDINAFKDLLTKFERSIRVIDIDSLTVESSDDKYTMTITAHAYYEPAKKIELTKEVEKP